MLLQHVEDVVAPLVVFPLMRQADTENVSDRIVRQEALVQCGIRFAAAQQLSQLRGAFRICVLGCHGAALRFQQPQSYNAEVTSRTESSTMLRISSTCSSVATSGGASR